MFGANEFSLVRYDGIFLGQEISRMQEETARKNYLLQPILMEPIPDFIFRLGQDGIPVDCGIACSQDLLGKKLDEVLPLEIAEVLIEQIEGALARNNISKFEWELLFEGSRRKFEARAIANTSENIILLIRELTQTKPKNKIKEIQNGHKPSTVELSSMEGQNPAVIYLASLENPSNFVYVSSEIENLVGYSQNELLSNPNLWYQCWHPQERERAFSPQGFIGNKDGKELSKKWEYRLVNRRGEVVWIEDKAVVVTDEENSPILVRGIMVDISDRKQLEQLLDAQKYILELIALGAPLSHTLNVLIQEMEEQSNGMLGSIWLLDAEKERLKIAVAPNIPQDYIQAINDVKVNNYGGAFSKVISDRQSVIIADTATDPLWTNHRDLALSNGLKASWLVPIFSSEGWILGVFAMYYSQPRTPSSEEQKSIEIATNLASIAIERQQVENEVRRTNSLLKAQQEAAIDGILHVDENRQIASYNNRLISMWQVPDRVLNYRYDKKLLIFILSKIKNFEDFRAIVEDIYKNPGEQRRDEIYLKDGRIFDCYSGPVVSSMGKNYGRMWYFRDITESRKSEIRIEEAEEKYRGIFENAIEGIFQSTVDGRYLSANYALAKIYGYNSAEDFVEKIADIQTQLYVDKNRRSEFIRLLEKNDKVSNFEYQSYRKDGTIIWVSENCRAVRDSQGNLLYYEGTLENITERKQAEDKLLQNAFYDALTGLLNRAAFMEKLHESLFHARQIPNALFAVLFIDLDRFKVINDSLGHELGDQLLIKLSNRLKNSIEERDTLARLSGDEFAILVEEVRDITEVKEIADRLQKALTLPFKLDRQEVFTSASIGIAFSQSNSEIVYNSPEHLLRDASTAMYHAKRAGKACCKVFNSTMQTNFLSRLQLETDLRRAIEREELRLHYQLIVSLLTGHISGFEALVRWQHPQFGLVSPGRFIPLAEETGLIVPIGEWVLREACRQMESWQTEGLVSNIASMSVNVAGRQFAELDLVKKVQDILEETSLAPSNLRIEITEGVMMESVHSVTTQLNNLCELGVQLSLDDFGTGYSSLTRLQSFPIDTLKIDRSFVSRMGKNGENWEIVQTIINLALHLGMNAIAEGIETPDHALILKNLGCHYGQGYLFSKPLNSDDIVKLIANESSSFLA
ncbi:MAG: EAL domain-containing protein [Cyanobacteriota bacterium]|nr:EAL domain-containing protein [Cyanobacteriota bacterium]